MLELVIGGLIKSLKTYYGLDWLAFILGAVGMYMLSEKHKVGFLFKVVGSVSAAICSIIAGQFGFLVSNMVMFGVALYGYKNWSDSENDPG